MDKLRMLVKLGFLKEWEAEFMGKYSHGDSTVAMRMAAEHLLRNAELAGRPVNHLKEVLASLGM